MATYLLNMLVEHQNVALDTCLGFNESRSHPGQTNLDCYLVPWITVHSSDLSADLEA